MSVPGVGTWQTAVNTQRFLALLSLHSSVQRPTTKKNKPTEKVNYTTGEKSVSVTEKRESR